MSKDVIETEAERLSAFMDGELSVFERERFVQQLVADDQPEHRQRWERYHLIRSTLHRELPTTVHLGLSERVSQQLESEPQHHHSSKRLLPRLTKPMLGMAMAASVAFMAVVGLKAWLPSNPLESSTIAQQTTPTVSPQLASTPLQSKTEARLSRYLVNHNEFSRAAGMKGALPYMRVVGNNSGDE